MVPRFAGPTRQSVFFLPVEVLPSIRYAPKCATLCKCTTQRQFVDHYRSLAAIGWRTQKSCRYSDWCVVLYKRLIRGTARFSEVGKTFRF
jgi:hypothetical protein